MVRVSLEGLLPGLRDADAWLHRATGGLPAARDGFVPDGAGRLVTARGPAVAAHVLAGNTPLLAWSGLAAALLAGSASYVKMSRDETLWPRLFVASLAEADPLLASLIHLDAWPGEDARTAELLRASGAVIAYGSDETLAALRASTPIGVRFLGYGHALSVGLSLAPARGGGEGFARDVLLYDQGGCLSPHAIFVEGAGRDAAGFGDALTDALAQETEALAVPPVADPAVALAVRRARDLALFSAASVRGDPLLRWTVITETEPRPLPEPVGHGVVHVVPIHDVAADLGPALRPARGRVSAVGVAGALRDDVRAALAREGISRLCAPGRMQAPPLGWRNGGRDLLADLLYWSEEEPRAS